MIKLFAVSIILLVGSCQNAFAIELNAVFRAMASTPEKHVLFKETRTASFLDEPMISKGSLEFRAPDIMIKRINEPENIVQYIEGNTLSISHGKEQKEVISLLSQPGLAAGINAIRWILSGNEQSLMHAFKVNFKNTENQWVITLKPKDAEVASNISEISIEGKRHNIIAITTVQSDGDSIKTVLYDHR